MSFFQKPRDHFHDSLCPTLTGMKVDKKKTAVTDLQANHCNENFFLSIPE